eukprot:1614678-Lingulodinium_polyedra.AAC.1
MARVEQQNGQGCAPSKCSNKRSSAGRAQAPQTRSREVTVQRPDRKKGQPSTEGTCTGHAAAPSHARSVTEHKARRPSKDNSAPRPAAGPTESRRQAGHSSASGAATKQGQR